MDSTQTAHSFAGVKHLNETLLNDRHVLDQVPNSISIQPAFATVSFEVFTLLGLAFLLSSHSSSIPTKRL